MSNTVQVGLNAIQEEFNKIEEQNAWNEVYQKVRVEGTYDLSCSEALRASNKTLNRYKDVHPYDHSRVMLEECDTDYVNASFVEVESIGRKYILCQGPLPQTTQHFWLLIWEQNTKAIVMLNRIVEKNQIKCHQCHQYWPNGKKKGGYNTNEFPSVNLTVELTKDVQHSHYVYRVFKLTNTNTKESREILHFHYTTWSDFGVPQPLDAFFKFLSVVRASECLESHYGPAVIHCSAGIGRSGTFCLVDTILLMLEYGLCSEKPGKILEVLLDMRRYRMGLIHTSEQLRFSYQAILFGAQKKNETNGMDPNEESSSDEISVEEPPPPPPRTDSLSRSIFKAKLEEMLKLNSSRGNDDEDDDDDDDDDTDSDDSEEDFENGNKCNENQREKSKDEEDPAEQVSSKDKDDKSNDKVCATEDSQPTSPDGHASNPWDSDEDEVPAKRPRM